MKKTNVKNRILNTATHLFYTQGVKNTGINQIIKESNTAKASFYQYFASKDELINACLDEYCKTLAYIFNSVIDKSKSIEDFAKKWKWLLKKSAYEPDTFMGCPIANVGFQTDLQKNNLQAKFNQIIDDWYKIFEKLFQKSIASKEISQTTDLQHLFRSIVEINEGALIMWRLTGKIEYIDSLSKSIIKLIR